MLRLFREMDLGVIKYPQLTAPLFRGLTLMRRRACKWKLLRRIEQIALWEITLPPTIFLPFIYLPNHLDRDTGQMLLPAVPSWEGSF